MGKEQQPVQPVGRTEVAKLQYPFKLGHICSVVPCLYGYGLDTPSIYFKLTPCGGYLDILGSLSNAVGDGNENGKMTIGLY